MKTKRTGGRDSELPATGAGAGTFYANCGPSPRTVVKLPGTGRRRCLDSAVLREWVAEHDNVDGEFLFRNIPAARKAEGVSRMVKSLTAAITGKRCGRAAKAECDVKSLTHAAQADLAKLAELLRSRRLIPKGVSFARRRDHAGRDLSLVGTATAEEVAVALLGHACFSPPLILRDRPPSLAWIRADGALDLSIIDPELESR